jgi:serpin B
MKPITLTLLLTGVAAAALALSAQSQSAAGQSPDTAAVVKGNDAFAVDLYQQLSAKEGNLFFSPYSISNALAMTYAGARGQTAAEMERALHLPLGQDKLHPAFGALVRQINGSGQPRKYALTVANRLWGQKDYDFRQDFLKLTHDHYDAGLKEVDFSNAAEAARKEINAWVEEQTKDKIKELIKPNAFDKDTRLVLTNAIYFKAAWHYPFAKGATAPGKFLLPGNKAVEVPLMYQTIDAAYYYNGGSFALLDLPYKSGELSMVVLLPKDVDGLPALEKSLSADKLVAWMSKVGYAKVNLTLPKFKVTSEFMLNDALAALGMKLAFTELADFSGMTTRDKLYISSVVHKAFIDVHEDGTEAAAATAMSTKVVFGIEPVVEPVTFRADHPFVYLIRDNRAGSILFMGRVANPQ